MEVGGWVNSNTSRSLLPRWADTQVVIGVYVRL